MRTSDNGINLIKHFEGLRLKAYLDQAGIPTIGVGHTQGVNMGDTITEVKADSLLVEDLKVAEDYVNTIIFAALNNNQFDALVSFTFNLGGNSLRKSRLRTDLNAGKYVEAASDFLNWAMVAGKHSDSVYKRRQAEKKLFETPIDQLFVL